MLCGLALMRHTVLKTGNVEQDPDDGPSAVGSNRPKNCHTVCYKKNCYKENPNLDGIAPYVEDSGEGRWTIQEAIDLDVPAHSITSSLYSRFYSRNSDSFSFKVLSSLRNQFGGHNMKKSN